MRRLYASFLTGKVIRDVKIYSTRNLLFSEDIHRLKQSETFVEHNITLEQQLSIARSD